MSRRARIALAAAGLLVLALGVRVLYVGSRQWTTVDPWHAPPSDQVEALGWTALPRHEVRPVSEAGRSEAIDLLAESSAIALDEAAAARLAGAPELPVSGTPFLVRALVLNRGTGSFNVSSEGSGLRVHHGSLGHGGAPMTKWPIVVYLPALPTQVYVTVSMAE